MWQAAQVVVKKEAVLNECGSGCADLRTGRTVNTPVIKAQGDRGEG